MNKQRTLIVIIFLCWMHSNLTAGVNPAAFLNKGVGARALGMGGAFTAVADDATAAYWNPAGLGNLEGYHSSFMLQRLSSAVWPGIEDITPTYQYFNIIIPSNKLKLFSRGTIGMSAILFGMNNIPHTYVDSSGALHRDVFKDTESAYYISIGYPLLPNNSICVGGSFKYISQVYSGIEGGSAWGWDVDMGMLLKLKDNLNVGLVANKGPELNWESGYTDQDSLRIKLGSSYRYDINEKMNILGACDLIQKKDMPLKSSMGIEFTFLPEIGNINRFNTASVRAGVDKLAIENRYNNISKLNRHINWNVGAGIDVGIYLFDLQI
ncbi:hypothetical protein ACFLUV_07095, partial [Elusimicrobiota bacterium]